MSISAGFAPFLTATVVAAAEVAPPTVAPTTGPTSTSGAFDLAIAFAMVAIGLTVAATLRVFRPRSIEGPPRLTPDMSARPLFLVTLLAGGAWLFMQLIYIRWRIAQLGPREPGFQFTAEHFTSADFAFLSTVPFFVGLAVFIIGDRILGRGLIERIGFDGSKLLRGVLIGALAMLSVFPLMFGGGILLEAFYRATNVEHPPAHDLLTAMREVSAPARAAMIIGACVGAPLFEEMLFRGHIQTLLARLFTRRTASAVAETAVPTPDGAGVHLASPPVLGYEPVADVKRSCWPAVFITAFLFAVIHPMWTAPLILLLAVCLGYAYERTGNLWVPIVMHALFNAGSTVVFLSGS